MVCLKDGKLLAAAGDDRMVRIWNCESEQVVEKFVGHTSTITSVSFSHDGRTLATSSENGVVRLWNVTPGMQTKKSDHREVETSLAISPQHGLLAIGWGSLSMQTGKGGLRFWDLETFQPRDMPLDLSSVAHILSLDISPTDPILITGGGRRRDGGEVKVWDIQENELILDLPGYTDTVYAVAISPDGQLLASAGKSNMRTVKLWDAKSGKLQHEFELSKVYHGKLVSDADVLQFSPDGTILAAGGGRFDGERGVVEFWDVASRTKLETVSFEGGNVHALVFFADGDRVAIAHAGRVSLYEISTGSQTQLVTTGIQSLSLAISPDGATLAIGSKYSGVRLWHPEAGGQLGVLPVPHRVTDLSFTPNGKSLIAACDDTSVWVWTAPLDETSRSNLVVLRSDGAPVRVRPWN